MFAVELPPEANKVRHDVGGDHNVVFHKWGHRRLLQFFDDFGCANHRLTEAGVLHVKAFKFGFLFSKEVQRCLVRLTALLFHGGFLNRFGRLGRFWFRCRFFSWFGSRGFLNGFWFGRRFWFRCRFFSGRRSLGCFGLNGFGFLFGSFLNRLRLS